jgi:hypothetical protein
MISYRSQPFVPTRDPAETARNLAGTTSYPRRKPGSRRRDARKGLIGRPMSEITARVQTAVLEFDGTRLTTEEISDLTRLARDYDLYRACEYMCQLRLLRRVAKGVFVKTVIL